MNMTDIKTDAYSIGLLCNSLNAHHIEALHRGDERLSNLLLIAQGTINKLCKEKQERQKGKWIDLKCNRCGQVDMSKPNFCPNCGADMRGEET